MKFQIPNPTETHLVFAWLPLLVVDRANGKTYWVWLQRVQRRLVSIQGATVWAYTLPS